MTTEEYVSTLYNEALTEYMKIGKSKGILISTLQRGPNEYNIGKLSYLLKEKGFIVPGEHIQELTISPTQEEKLGTKDVQTTFQLDTLVLKSLNDKKIELLKEVSFIHANKLDDDSISESEMKDYSLRILEIYKKDLPAITAKIEFYTQNGELPEEKGVKTDIDPTSEIDLFKRILTLRKNISRDKANPKRTQHVPKWEAELSTLSKHYDAIVKNKKPKD